MGRPANTDVSREVAMVVREFSDRYGPLYVKELLLPRLLQNVPLCERTEETARAMLLEPVGCLRAIFQEYAFSRRGRERHELGVLASDALKRATAETELFNREDSVFIWEAFEALCQEKKEKPMEQLNRGILQGIPELAQEIQQNGGSGSIALWIVDSARKTGRIENQFMRMVEVRGVGPKLASMILRDVVYLFNLEDRIDPVDRLYMQPIDRWMRVCSEFVVDDYDDPADWILAGKLSKVARKSGAKGCQFNMGVTYFGTRVVHSPEAFANGLIDIVNAHTRMAKGA